MKPQPSIQPTQSYTPPSKGAAPTTSGTASTGGASAESAKAPAQAAAPPPSIPGYQLLDVLGKGGMGIVYRAKQLSLNRLVALKMIRGDGFLDDEHLNRFRTEGQALARLQHPNVVQVFEVGQHQNVPYCALEYVDGGSLSQKLGGIPRPAKQSAQLVLSLAKGVQAAHQAGVLHRDLKPANVLVTRDWTLKISDFGLAKRLDDDSGQTRAGAVLGTPSYMAPEQATGNQAAIGPGVDVYALGAILYEMLTGRPPFRGATALDTLHMVREQEPVSVRQLNSKVPRDLETICHKCLLKDSSRRYPTAQAFAEDLERFIEGKPILARPVGWLERMLKWSQRYPLAAALLVATSLGIVAAVIASFIAVGQSKRALAAERTKLHEERERLLDSELHQASLAAQAGNWKVVLDRFAAVEKSGHRLTVKQRMERAKANIALFKVKDALTEYEELAKLPLGADEALVKLHHANLLLGESNDKALAIIRECVKGDLPKAERLFAEGLLADSTVAAVAKLQEAVKADPSHREARSYLGICLVLLGRLLEAESLADRSLELFPKHPDFAVMKFLTLISRVDRPENNERDRTEIEAKIKDTRERLTETYGAEIITELEGALRTYALVGKVAALAGRGEVTKEDLIDVERIKKMSRHIDRLSFDYKVTDDRTHARMVVRMPPSISTFFSQMAEIGELRTGAPRLDMMRENAEKHPEGMLLFVYATTLYSDAKTSVRGDLKGTIAVLRKVADALDRAAEAHFLIDARVAVRDMCIQIHGLLGDPKLLGHVEAKEIAKAHAYLKKQVEVGEHKTKNPVILANFVRVAQLAADLPLARSLLDHWEATLPRTLEPVLSRGMIELEARNYQAAIESCRRGLAVFPENAELQAIQAKARSGLEDLLRGK